MPANSDQSQSGRKRRTKKYMPSQASLANLKPGYHGQNNSNNGVSLTTELKVMLRKNTALRQRFIQSTIDGAIAREPTPFREVWDRMEGKLTDKVIPPNVNVVFVIGKGYSEAAGFNSSPLIEATGTLAPPEMEE